MKKLASLLLFFLFLLPLQAHASRFISGDTITIPKQDVVDENAYIAGGTARVDGMVNGDLYVAGGTTVVNGTIAGDTTLVGGTVDFNGTSRGDIRVAGGNVVLQGNVLGEVIVFGGTIAVTQSASTTGQVTLIGGQITLEGTTTGDTRVYGEKVIIRGQVNGPLTVEANEVTVASSAVVTGPFTYSSPNKATIESGSKLPGGVTYHQTSQKEESRGGLAAFAGFAWLYGLITSLIVGAVIYALLPTTVAQVVRYSGKRPGLSALFGLAALILTPVIVVLLMITVIGVPLGLLLILLYVLAIILGSAFGGIFLGSLLWKLFKKLPEYPLNWSVVLVGILCTSLLGLIPFIGWLLQFALFLIGFGGILWYSTNARTSARNW